MPVSGARTVDLRLDRLGGQGEGKPPPRERARREGGDGGRERRERSGRRLCCFAESGHLTLGQRRHERRDEFGLGREVAVDRARRDTGALGDRRNLHGRHPVGRRDLAGRRQDCVVTGGKPADHIFRSAVGHANLDSNK